VRGQKFPLIAPSTTININTTAMGWGNPTSFLPALPRDQGTLAPLAAADLIGYMEILKEMYMPPIHGGFTAADMDFEADTNDRQGQRRKKKRTLSGGSVDLPGLDLDMEGLGLNEIDEEPDESTDDEDNEGGYSDPFEREWAEKWLNGVVRRAQTWLEANDFGDEPSPEEEASTKEVEAVLRDATAVLALMAGTGAAGGLTRHLLFPLAPELAPGLRAFRPVDTAGLSPETTRFLARLSTSPTQSGLGRSPTLSRSPLARSPGMWRGRPAALPVLLHDAPITDHISVGVQTWGSAILLGREMSLRPTSFGLFLPHSTRVLELGAGTGLLSILCRKLLDLRAASAAMGAPTSGPMGTSPEKNGVPDTGLVVATDFHPDVLSNLRVCVDLNATPRLPDAPPAAGIEVAKLDWCTFPAFMKARAQGGEWDGEEEELVRWLDNPFDLVIASDCVYDPTHAGMIREVAAWVVRPPGRGDTGGVLVSTAVPFPRADSSTSSRPSGRRSRPSSSRSTSRSPRCSRTRPSPSAGRPPRPPRPPTGCAPAFLRSCGARGSAQRRGCGWACGAGSGQCRAAREKGERTRRVGTGGGRLDGDRCEKGRLVERRVDGRLHIQWMRAYWCAGEAAKDEITDFLHLSWSTDASQSKHYDTGAHKDAHLRALPPSSDSSHTLSPRTNLEVRLEQRLGDELRLETAAAEEAPLESAARTLAAVKVGKLDVDVALAHLVDLDARDAPVLGVDLPLDVVREVRVPVALRLLVWVEHVAHHEEVGGPLRRGLGGWCRARAGGVVGAR
jgi:predicted nicotinamide N-methyase